LEVSVLAGKKGPLIIMIVMIIKISGPFFPKSTAPNLQLPTSNIQPSSLQLLTFKF
jgi:hypothetical protein